MKTLTAAALIKMKQQRKMLHGSIKDDENLKKTNNKGHEIIPFSKA